VGVLQSHGLGVVGEVTDVKWPGLLVVDEQVLCDL